MYLHALKARVGTQKMVYRHRILLGLLVGLCLACAAVRPPATPAGSPLLQFGTATFDGFSLSGNVLIGARGGAILLDQDRPGALEVRDVTSCLNKEPLRHSVSDDIVICPSGGTCEAPPTTRVDPDSWRSVDFSFTLFHDAGQSCVELTIVMFVAASRQQDGDAAIRLRAVRNGTVETL